MNSMKREYRYGLGLELRQESGDSLKIAGYAAVFNQLSENLGWYRERILAGAFTKSLGKDLRSFNGHNTSQPIGRSKNGTLTAREDERGLWVEIIPPNNSVGRDVVENIRAGYIDQMSIGFVVERDKQRMIQENGEDIRELIEIDLFEVSPVALPAYPQTSIAVRSLWPDGIPEELEKLREKPVVNEIDWKTVTLSPIDHPKSAKPSAARLLVDELVQKYGLSPKFK